MILDNDGDAELYSPEGQCNYKLAQSPVRDFNPVLVNADDRIIACSGGKGCWEYNTNEDTWIGLIEAPFLADQQPGVIFNDQLFVTDMNGTHVLDLASNTWSKWPSPNKYSGNSPCLVGWRDSIILFGGYIDQRGVQILNITSQTWTALNSTNAPMDVWWSSAVLIDENEILITGSWSTPFSNSAAKYYPLTDSWIKLDDSEVDHSGTRLVKLGNRVFAVDGIRTDVVEEFDITNNTWTNIGLRTINSYQGMHSVLSLPASLFAHLPNGCIGVN